MKSLLPAAVAVCLAAPAMAADIPVKAPLAAPVFTWAGCYVGVNGGYGFTRKRDLNDTEFTNNIPGATARFGSLDPNGGFAGGQLGCNTMLWGGPWLLGIEADAHWANFNSSIGATVNNFLPGGLNATVTVDEHVRAFGTLRARFGYTWDRTLVYATGGFAWARVNYNFLFVDNFNFRAETNSRSMRGGYTIGGGIEHAFTQNLSLKVEYQYIDLGGENYVAPLFFMTNPPVPTVFSEHTGRRYDFHTVRAGLNWKLWQP